jgi:hypothetical protein
MNTTLAYEAGRFDGKQNAKKRMMIGGVEYESEDQASRMLGIRRQTISYRINSANFPMYVLA